MTKEQKEKVDDSFGDNLVTLLGALSKEMKDNPIEIESEFKYPMEISGIKKIPLKNINTKQTGSMVKVRPCADEYEKKTFLGIYIGDISIEFNIAKYTKTNILTIMDIANPAIFVPDLNKVIFGYESWWGYIKSEEELGQITDNDISNVWYVKALQQLAEKEKENERRARTEDSKTSKSD